MNRDHVQLVKFASIQDSDFQKVRDSLALMLPKAAEAIEASWQREVGREGL